MNLKKLLGLEFVRGYCVRKLDKNSLIILAKSLLSSATNTLILLLTNIPPLFSFVNLVCGRIWNPPLRSFSGRGTRPLHYDIKSTPISKSFLKRQVLFYIRKFYTSSDFCEKIS